jgi:hypothetical protein
MSLFAPLERIFEASAYRGCHAGLRRFIEDLDSIDSESSSHSPTASALNQGAVSDTKAAAPPLTDFVKRLRLPETTRTDEKSTGSNSSGRTRTRKRQNNDQLG